MKNITINMIRIIGADQSILFVLPLLPATPALCGAYFPPTPALAVLISVAHFISFVSGVFHHDAKRHMRTDHLGCHKLLHHW